jgi:hypothetical protein
MSVKTKRVSVTKRPSAEQIQNANRWEQFIKASGYSFKELTEEWLDFFSAQADPLTASTELVRLIDLAIAQDETK